MELLDKYGRRFASYRYSVWGGAQGSSSRATVNNGITTISAGVASDIMGRQHLRYAGYYYDTSTGLYYCSARYYDPDTRQFISRDPIKADGQESAYQYVNGNPVLDSDPSGLYNAVYADAKKPPKEHGLSDATLAQMAWEAAAHQYFLDNECALNAQTYPGGAYPKPLAVMDVIFPAFTHQVRQDAGDFAKGVQNPGAVWQNISNHPGDSARYAGTRALFYGSLLLPWDRWAGAGIGRIVGLAGRESGSAGTLVRAGADVAADGAGLAERGSGLQGFTGHGADQLALRGVRAPDVLDAYRNPLRVGEIKYDELGQPSVKYTGANATICVNPETMKVITGWPTSSKLAAKLTFNLGVEP